MMPCGQRVDDVQLFVCYLSLGLVQVGELELSPMGENNRNTDLLCEKNLSFTTTRFVINR